jgi:SAM-dependent methyltransferase
LSACRACGSGTRRPVLSLGMSPLANSYIRADRLTAMEPFYPLDVQLCGDCMLVQLDAVEAPENIFTDYAYFSSFSTTWVAHAEAYVAMMIERFGIGSADRVIEIASNDGYLLQHFQRRGVPVLGIEPAANIAKAAEAKGIPTRVAFWTEALGQSLAAGNEQADLILGNNVLAHVPALNDFIAGMKAALKPSGIITMEFPHLMRLIESNQFDTIYHEHFSYFSFFVVRDVFARHGITLFDVEELGTHGGSLRIFGRHAENVALPVTERVAALIAEETRRGMRGFAYYEDFAERVAETKRALLEFCIAEKRAGKRIVGYGAPAKGNTLLNYCGIRTDFLDYTLDRNPHKQGTFLPGTHIPVYAPERILDDKPEYLLILPWNLRDEIVEQMAHIREWGGRFVVPIPRVKVFG